MIPLPARLEGVLRLVPMTGAVADIGSGHGALALALAARGQRVVATERTPAAAARLTADIARRLEAMRRARVAPAPANAAVVSPTVRMGEGLAPLAESEVATAVIAGMGARSIVAILDSAPWLPRWLVLQPIQEPGLAAAWIESRGWRFTLTETKQGRRTYRAWRIEVPASVRRRRAAA
ncbi:MAG TPA: tRNA (adenine(22)-N(1))-methyltransferase TrmK [Candidatus Dormibacteraeota bacterium]|jgi:tRNA (adenine22-N1)-methyltransferase|nr:tRNA (adenine(22)-N(1))-methyltransferase TrmK [Candidatus Dormibacteraeota bacterium]